MDHTDTDTTRRDRRQRGERGLAVAMTGLLLIPLMVFAAFGVDMASWYARISELQRGADAAALAGAVWMPNVATACGVAEDSLRSNGLTPGTTGGQVTFECRRGSTISALYVSVTDTDARRHFSQIFIDGDAVLTRYAEAEYNLPLPLGSPLNYFGGDASRTAPSVTASGTPGAGTSSVPPPDYRTRAPVTTPCRVRANGNSGGTILGRWNAGPPPNFTTSTSGSSGMCAWQNMATTGLPSFYNTQTPINRPCNVGYADVPGRWTSGGSFQASSRYTGADGTSGNRLCTWLDASSPSNPISPTRSPGFWAAIEGPQVRAYQGDPYNTRCYTSNSCSGVQNAQYQPLSQVDRGAWYVIKIPTGLTGSVDINVFDASYVTGATEERAGDRSLDGGGTFTTQYRVYRQENALDFSQRTPLFDEGATPGTTEGACQWLLGTESQFSGQWRRLCTLTAVSPGQVYLINVQTPGTTGAGVNGYALEAVANGSHSGVQPALYAYSHMTMQNNNFCGSGGVACPPPPATFYLAEVGPQYAGRTLVMELWDPGDVGAGTTAIMTPMMPSTSQPRPVVAVPKSICTYTSTVSPNSAISGTTGTQYSTPQTSSHATECQIQTSTSGTSHFNGVWLQFRVEIPNDYTCTLGVNPETTAGSCWWGIRYNFTGSANDVTTWQARIEGNPLQLTE